MPKWDCDACTEQYDDYSAIDINGDTACCSCIRSIFQDALDHEHEYPAKWGIVIHPDRFSHILSEEFRKRYKAREVEYSVQPARRVYCNHELLSRGPEGRPSIDLCGTYLGTRMRKPPQQNITCTVKCPTCFNLTCIVCDEKHVDPAAAYRHECPGRSPAREEEARAFRGLVKGKHWQQCPNKACGRRIELAEACNHIECLCGTEFCFVCGKEADGGSDHWYRDGCPRYNQPGGLNAEYDEGDDDDSEHDLEGGEDNGGHEEDDMGLRGLFEDGDTTTDTSSTVTQDATLGGRDPIPAAGPSQWAMDLSEMESEDTDRAGADVGGLQISTEDIEMDQLLWNVFTQGGSLEADSPDT